MDASSSRPLKVGLFVTAMAGGMRDGALRWTDLRRMAETAEAVGFDSFWVPDHLIFKPEGETPHGPWECWSLIAALAASTSRLDLGSLVTCTHFRNPGLMAKMADTIDEISGGRLILGLGAGWHEPEFDAFGYPFDHRFERFEEALHIIRTLLRTGQIDHEGTYYTLRECELRPRGPRPEGPPMMIGALATKKRMLGLIARYADIWNGWLLHSRSHPDEVPPLTAALDEALRAAGRDPATIGRTVGIMVDQRSASERPELPVSGPDPRSSTATFLTGSNDDIAESLRQFARHGIDHIQITTAIQGVAGVEAFAPVLDLLDRE